MLTKIQKLTEDMQRSGTTPNKMKGKEGREAYVINKIDSLH